MKILITGATSPLGQKLALGLATSGHRLLLHGRDPSRLETLKNTYAALRDAGLLVADFLASGEIEAIPESTITGTDALINIAFGQMELPLVDAAPVQLRDFFDVSVTGTARMTRRLIPTLEEQQGQVVNIIADWGIPMHNIVTGPSPYIAAKYAVHGLGAALQTELTNIRVTNIFPGVIKDCSITLGEREFIEQHGSSAIHPGEVLRSVEYVLSTRNVTIRSIVLSPTSTSYRGE